MPPDVFTHAGLAARGGGRGDDGARRVSRSRCSPASPTSSSRSPSPSTTGAGSGSPRPTRIPIRVPEEKARGPDPDLRGHRRRRPVRHAQGVRREAEPGQRDRARVRRRLGRRGAELAVHPRPATATTGPTARPRCCSTAGATQDTHETLNSFTWGPDGWLYGCHGVFTHSRVGKPGTPDAERMPINAGIWRYHPTRHVFEVFAHGTSNPWGIDFDDHGRRSSPPASFRTSIT